MSRHPALDETQLHEACGGWQPWFVPNWARYSLRWPSICMMVAGLRCITEQRYGSLQQAAGVKP